ncbi:UNVERIFIED_CONTAM: hypothetical protein GTU68_015600 [Idotea baltica]|nr:hypothetical protein [Idotea baltica]
MTTFADLGLNAELVQAVEKLGYDEPTPIQEGVIPLLCAGRDVIGQAQTGTGKTAAFALPILNKMTGATGKVQALVVCPTRELANQVSRSFKEFAHFSDIRVFAVYGGQAYGPQRHALRKGVDIVVGTPGRLLDLIRRGDLDLSHAQTIALDEARERVMSRFRNDQTKILVATDVAARGLDVDDVSHVINYNLPTEIESYVHRIGRTARAGKTGAAISLVSPSERGRLSRIEKLVRATIPRTAIPSTEDIQLLRDKRLEEKMDTKLRRGRFSAERTIVDQLVADGHDPLDIASAALRLNRALDQERDIPHVSDVDDRPQKSRPSGRGGYKGKNGPRGGGYKGKGGHKSGGYKGKSGGKPGQQTRKRNKNASS